MIQYANMVANITKLKDQSKSILEIGSRDGKDAEKLRSIFKIDPTRVYIVEPNPEQAPKIRAAYPSAHVFEFAISNQAGEASFNKVKQSQSEMAVGASSLLERPGFYDNISEKVTVSVRTGDYLLDQIDVPNIDLCKIDVEGHTFEVLESFGAQIQRINTFHIESEHIEKWKGQKLYEVNKAFLESQDYTQIMFMYVWGGVVQSDSVWAKNSILKGA